MDSGGRASVAGRLDSMGEDYSIVTASSYRKDTRRGVEVETPAAELAPLETCLVGARADRDLWAAVLLETF